MPQRARRASDAAYSFVGRKHCCAYCGQYADAQDHTVPASVLHGAIDLMTKYRFFIVASCTDCNSRAGVGVDRTFLGRRQRIAKSLRRSKARYLKTPDYSSEELSEYGRNMRSTIERGQAVRDLTLERLAVLESFTLPADVPDDLAEPVEPGTMPFWVSLRKSIAEPSSVSPA